MSKPWENKELGVGTRRVLQDKHAELTKALQKISSWTKGEPWTFEANYKGTYKVSSFELMCFRGGKGLWKNGFGC
jgi:hypothetical protein